MKANGKTLCIITAFLLFVASLAGTCTHLWWAAENRGKIERQYEAALSIKYEADAPDNAGVIPLLVPRYIYAHKKLERAAKTYAEGMLRFEAEKQAYDGTISEKTIEMYDKAASVDTSLTKHFNVLSGDIDGRRVYSNAMKSYMDVRKYVEEAEIAFMDNGVTDIEEANNAINKCVSGISFISTEEIMYLVIRGIICPAYAVVAAVVSMIIFIKERNKGR